MRRRLLSTSFLFSVLGAASSASAAFKPPPPGPFQRPIELHGQICVEGVAAELCEISKLEKKAGVLEALAKVRGLEAKYHADPAQLPAYLALRFRTEKQARMNRNGSAATDHPDDPGGLKLKRMQQDAVAAFQAATYHALPYLPYPLVAASGGHQQPHQRSLREEMFEATLAMRQPLNREAFALLDRLANGLAQSDPVAAAVYFDRARAELAASPLDKSWAISLLIDEASLRRQFKKWGTSDDPELGTNQLLQAMVLMHRTPTLSSGDFRYYFNRVATAWSTGLRSYYKKNDLWTPELQNRAWQIDALLDLLRLDRPKDAIVHKYH